MPSFGTGRLNNGLPGKTTARRPVNINTGDIYTFVTTLFILFILFFYFSHGSWWDITWWAGWKQFVRRQGCAFFGKKKIFFFLAHLKTIGPYNSLYTVASGGQTPSRLPLLPVRCSQNRLKTKCEMSLSF